MTSVVQEQSDEWTVLALPAIAEIHSIIPVGAHSEELLGIGAGPNGAADPGPPAFCRQAVVWSAEVELLLKIRPLLINIDPPS